MLKNDTNSNIIKSSSNSILLLNLLLASFPISFILGNLIININVILFCILGIIHLKSKILTTNFNISIKVIFLLFFLIFFSTLLSFIKYFYFEGFDNIHLVRLTKSIMFFRFFLMLMIIYLLSELDVLKFKYFFITAACSPLIVALDVIYQYVFGVNIFGLKSHGTHNSGFFGEEWIAGGYIQNFSFFSILLSSFILKDKKKLWFFSTIILLCIFGLSIVFSGNRMPLILYIFGLFLLFLFNNKFRIIIPVSLIFFALLFKFVLSHDSLMKDKFVSMYSNIQGIMGVFVVSEPDEGNLESKINEQENSNKLKEDQKSYTKNKKFILFNETMYQSRLFLTAFDTWKKNKIFGNGIKSFRLDCYNLQGRDLLDENATYEYNLTEEYMENKKNRLCSNHPHNYYFEILTEIGVLGLFVTIIIASLFIVFIIRNFKLLKENSIENSILLAAVISLFLEVFPIKSSGSLFSTNDAAYITLIASIILTYKKKIN